MTSKRKATPKKPAPPAIAVEVTQRDTVETVSDNYYVYGSLTLQDRALPDYRDGLLKAHRRILWAMHHTAPATKPVVKSARVVGDVIGKYHPHGDAAAYSALVTLVNNTFPLAEGEGNWGTHEDPPAAARYTNVRMSKRGADILTHPDYLDVIELMPNYDGKDVEPVLLPARLPNILLNGGTGIAVGLNSIRPAFREEGIVRLLKGMLKGKKLTAAQCTKALEICFPYGGTVFYDGQESEVTALFETGKASLHTYCDLDTDEKARTITVLGIPPRLDIDRLLTRLKELDCFTSVQNTLGRKSTTPVEITCVLKRGVKMDDALEQTWPAVYVKLPFNLAVVEREYSEETQSVSAEVHQWGVIQIMERWLEWRIDLERRMLTHRRTLQDAKLRRLYLLLLAQVNRQVIASSWEQANQDAYLLKELAAGWVKITKKFHAAGDLAEVDVSYILSQNLRRLGKLDRAALEKDIAEVTEAIAGTETDLRDVPAHILKTL